MTANSASQNFKAANNLSYVPLNSLTPVFPKDAEPGDLVFIAGAWVLKLQNDEGAAPVGYFLTGSYTGKVGPIEGGLGLKLSHDQGWQVTANPSSVYGARQFPALSVTEAGIVLHGVSWLCPEFHHSFSLSGDRVQETLRHVHFFTEFSVWLNGPDGMPWGDCPLFTCTHETT